MPIVTADKISKCYRIYRHPSDHLKELLFLGKRQYHQPFWAVKDVDLQIERGACLGIIGENGSGKSTLLRIIAGVVRPTSGGLAVSGRISALLELGAGFNPHFTGRANVFLNASILGFTDAQTRQRMSSIEKFAEIGDFIDRPVKTYSSGMFVRLAFAVAIHLDPDVLIVDEALSVGDIFFQQRCIRRIQQLKSQGVTILFVSHDLETVRSLADGAIWMDHGRVLMEGRADDVTAKYLAAMVTRGRKEVMDDSKSAKPIAIPGELDIAEEARAKIPKFLFHVPNMDHRFGNGRARIQGIGIYSAQGDPVSSVAQSDRICLRISVEFQAEVLQPNVGFMLRNRLGEDVTGTNLMVEGVKLPPAGAGERLSVDFVMDVPFLHSGYYYFSPAVADGALNQYEMCDWIDNASAIEVIERTTTYGHMRIPVRAHVTAITRETSSVP